MTNRPKNKTREKDTNHDIPQVELSKIKHVGMSRSLESSSIKSPALTADQIAGLADLI